MVKMKALAEFSFQGKLRKPGDTINATELEAKILRIIKRAEDVGGEPERPNPEVAADEEAKIETRSMKADDETPAKPAKAKGKYNRRDMKARD